jgi:hypothetical protein
MAMATAMAITRYSVTSRAKINLLFFFSLSIANFFTASKVPRQLQEGGYKIVTIGVAFVSY